MDNERDRLMGEGILAVSFYSNYFIGESNFLVTNLIVYLIFRKKILKKWWDQCVCWEMKHEVWNSYTGHSYILLYDITTTVFLRTGHDERQKPKSGVNVI